MEEGGSACISSDGAQEPQKEANFGNDNGTLKNTEVTNGNLTRKRGWEFVKNNLDKILEYGRREGIITRKQIEINETEVKSKNNGDDEDDELEKEAKKELSFMHSAIPYLPLTSAVICLLLNILIPGSGTILSGIFCLFFGKCRIQMKEGRRSATLFMNAVVGVCQFFTITFLLVGWFWSISWGSLILMHSMQYRQARIKNRKVLVTTVAIEALTNNDLRRRQNVENLVT